MKHELNFMPEINGLSGYRPLTLSEFARLKAADKRATAHLHPKRAEQLREKRQSRWPVPCVDEDGIDCYAVPLDDDHTTHALVEASDYWKLRDGGADGLWTSFTRKNGRDKQVQMKIPMRKGQPGHWASPARLILNLSGGRRVVYLDGDGLDLRRKNLAHTFGNSRVNSASIARRGAERRDKLVAEGRTVGFPA